MTRVLIGFVLVAVSSGHPTFAGTVYDASADFSTSSNPTGVWSYGSTTSLGGTFALGVTNGVQNGINYWVNNWLGGAPSVTYNATPSPISYAGVTWDPGQLAIHPGPSDQNAVIRFTAPSTGMYSLSASFSGLDTTPTSTDVHVLLDNASIFDGAVNAFGAGPIFSSVLDLTAGDTLDLAVGFGSDGSYFNDTTGIEAIITNVSTVPEPSTFVVSMILLGTFAAVRSRQYRKSPGATE
jgi:hypothetical protein